MTCSEREVITLLRKICYHPSGLLPPKDYLERAGSRIPSPCQKLYFVHDHRLWALANSWRLQNQRLKKATGERISNIGFSFGLSDLKDHSSWIIDFFQHTDDIFLKSQKFRRTKKYRYAYGSFLRTLHRILKMPLSIYPILYLKTQNRVKLKKPVISMTLVGWVDLEMRFR